jgi:hypothetical protein
MQSTIKWRYITANVRVDNIDLVPMNGCGLESPKRWVVLQYAIERNEIPCCVRWCRKPGLASIGLTCAQGHNGKNAHSNSGVSLWESLHECTGFCDRWSAPRSLLPIGSDAEQLIA